MPPQLANLRKNVQKIKTKRKWALSATPYTSKPENLFSLLSFLLDGHDAPDWSHDFRIFTQIFTGTLNDYSLLRARLAMLSLRREKTDIFDYYRPEAEGITIPNVRFNRTEGRFAMTDRQIEITCKIVENFGDFVRQYIETYKSKN